MSLTVRKRVKEDARGPFRGRQRAASRWHVLSALGAWMCLLAAGVGLAGTAQAQSAWSSEEPCLPDKVDGSRSLQGHAFIPFVVLPFPFATTHVTSRTGVGLVDLTAIPVVNVGILEEDAQLVLLTQSFSLDVALARFLAISTGLVMGNAVGINESGAFNLGINYAVGASVGAIVRLAHGRRWYLSLRADYSLLRAQAVLPVALTQTAVVRDGEVVFNLDALTRGGRVNEITAPLMFAVSPVRWWGLQGSVGFTYLRADINDPDTKRKYVSLGLGSSFRFDSFGVPLAVMLGGSLRLRAGDELSLFFPTVESSGKVLGDLEAGLLYSSPRFVDVGLEAGFRLAEWDRRAQLQIVLYHFW